MGCSDPKEIGPHVTVRVGRRVVLYRSTQYWSRGPYSTSRRPDFMEGVQRTDSVVSVDMRSFESLVPLEANCLVPKPSME